MRHISICCDKNYLVYTKNLVKSIGKNNKGDFSICIFFGGNKDILLKSGIKELVESYGYKFDYYVFDDSVGENLKTCTYLGKSTYYRLYIPKILLTKGVKSTLYLDCDIVCDGKLDSIFKMDLNNKFFAVAMENSSTTFNAGVMYINIDKREKDGLTNKLLDFIENNPDKIIAGDQSALNELIPTNEYIVLQPRFNLCIQYWYYKKENTNYNNSFIKSEIKNGVLYHFNAKKKPWHFFCLHPKCAIYYKYMYINKFIYLFMIPFNIIYSAIGFWVFKTGIINKLYDYRIFKSLFLKILTGHK